MRDLLIEFLASLNMPKGKTLAFTKEEAIAHGWSTSEEWDEWESYYEERKENEVTPSTTPTALKQTRNEL